MKTLVSDQKKTLVTIKQMNFLGYQPFVEANIHSISEVKACSNDMLSSIYDQRRLPLIYITLDYYAILEIESYDLIRSMWTKPSRGVFKM